MIRIFLFLIFIQAIFSFLHADLLTIPLRPDKNVPFFNLNSINNNCPNIEIIFDTGSTDLWIADITCTQCPKQSINCMQYLDTNNLTPRQIQYATGWVKGYQINYSLCGIPTQIICVTKAQNILHFNSDGVLGVGNNQTGKQFINKLFSSNQQQRVSLFNRRYSKRLIFNDLQQELFNDKYLSPQQVIVQANNQWNIQLQNVIINQEVISDKIPAMIDTGSQLLSFPQQLFQKIKTTSQNILSTNCTSTKTGLSCRCQNSYQIYKLPNITISMQNTLHQSQTFTIRPHSYGVWKNKQCLILITSIPILGNKIILGYSFLNQYPTTFNFKTHAISIVKIDHKKLNSVENINLFLIILIVIFIVIVLSRVCVEVIRYLDEPNKLII